MDPRLRRHLLLSLVVSAGFLYLAFRNVSLAELGSALARVHAGWLLIAVGLSLLLMVLRAARWQLELRPLVRVPLARLWVVTAVAYMAINLMPVRLGEVVRPWLLSRREPVTFANVVGNLVVEKTMDSLVILVYILAGLLMVENLPHWVRTGARFPAAAALLLIVLVLLLYWRGEAFFSFSPARVFLAGCVSLFVFLAITYAVIPLLPDALVHSFEWAFGLFSTLPGAIALLLFALTGVLLLVRAFPAFGAKLKRVIGAIVAGMQVIPNPGLLLAVFLVSLVLWFLPILSSYVIIRAFDFAVPFSAAVVVFIFIGFGTALPNLPGMIGPYQYACVLALGLFGVDQVDALAYGLVLNAVQFLTIIAQGFIALPFAGVNLADLRQAKAA